MRRKINKSGHIEFMIKAGHMVTNLMTGDSVCVNGVCLTVIKKSLGDFSVQAVQMTAQATTLGHLNTGEKVNLESAVRLDSVLGGHIVLGHVDGVGKITKISAGAESMQISVRLPEGLDKYIVQKGSIAIDGISLTVASISRGELSLSVIPHTYKNTTLKDKRAGDKVNIETDIFAKYIEKQVSQNKTGTLDEDKLAELGINGIYQGMN